MSRRKVNRPCGKTRRAWKMRLLWAQEGRCAGCSQLLDLDAEELSPEQITMDHVYAAVRVGGRYRLDNLLLMHRRCNENKDADMPNNHELYVLAAVKRRLPFCPKNAAQREAEVRAFLGLAA